MRNIFSTKKTQTIESNKDFQSSDSSCNELQLNEKIIESEMRYRRLFETAKDGILILDFEKGCIVDANPFIVKIIDYPIEEIRGKYLWEIGLFSNKDESQQAFIELKKNGYIRFEDMPIKSRNGKITQVEFVSNVYLVNNKKVIQCNVRDISERKLNERKQELTARILMSLNNHGDWKLSIKEIIIGIKNFICIDAVAIRLKEDEDFPYFEAMGFPDYFIQAKKYLCRRDIKGEIIYDEKGNPYLECMCGNIVAGRTDPSLPYFTKGGSFYSNNTSGLPPDVTEKGRLFAKCNQCNVEGFESVALIPIYSGKEIIGLLQLNDKRHGLFSLELIELLEKIGNTIGVAYNRVHNEKKIIESEQNLKKQNEEFISLNKIYLSLNQELIESVDHIQKINNELIIAKAKAEESDRLKSAFLANVSHEIRTPLNAIVGFSELLTKPTLSNNKTEDYIQIIKMSGQQLLSIISDIIDISRIETNQISIISESVNINDLLEGLFKTYEKNIGLRDLKLNYINNLPEDIIHVKTDGNRVKQILCNLLNNAIKFTKEGSIEFGCKIQDNYLQFYVKDTGIGVALESQQLIFERFRQVLSTDINNYGGSGLGLSISKALVEKMGGQIAINSELGIGSTFTFTIPYVKGINKDACSMEEITPKQSTNWNEKVILIVEDNKSHHDYLKELLSSTNIKMLHASDGKEAVALVNAHAGISLVLMDIKMPIMNGYEALRLIKQVRPKLPVIAQTAYALSHDKENALEGGFDSYISKPIDKDILIKLMENYLN